MNHARTVRSPTQPPGTGVRDTGASRRRPCTVPSASLVTCSYGGGIARSRTSPARSGSSSMLDNVVLLGGLGQERGERGAATGQPGLHRPFGDAEGERDFGDREVGEVVQGDGLPLPGR